MDIDLLTTFLEVSKTRHFGKASENLFITQSAVSARIKTLETALNTRLFERSTKQVNLTEEGEKFCLHAEKILLAWANAKFDVSSPEGQGESLALGTTAGLWHYVFNEKIAEVSQSKKFMINALAYAQDELSLMLYKHTLDIALVYEAINDSAFENIPLGNLHLQLVSHSDNAANYQVGSSPYIHVDWGNAFNIFIAKQFGENLPLAMKTDNAQTAQALLQPLQAAAYLPERLLQQQTAFRAVTLKNPTVFKRKVYACFASNSRKRSQIKALIKQLSF